MQEARRAGPVTDCTACAQTPSQPAYQPAPAPAPAPAPPPPPPSPSQPPASTCPQLCKDFKSPNWTLQSPETCNKYISVHGWCDDRDEWMQEARRGGPVTDCTACAQTPPPPPVPPPVPPPQPVASPLPPLANRHCTDVPPQNGYSSRACTNLPVGSTCAQFCNRGFDALWNVGTCIINGNGEPSMVPAICVPVSAQPQAASPVMPTAPAYVAPVNQYQTIPTVSENITFPINGSCKSKSPLTQAWIGHGTDESQFTTLADCFGDCIARRDIRAGNPAGKGCSAVSFYPRSGNRGRCTMHFGRRGVLGPDGNPVDNDSDYFCQ